MRTSRLISTPLAVTVSAAAFAVPAAASHVPGPPTWPEHPKPITSYARELPGPPTWPTDPKPIPAYRSTVLVTEGGFDWDSAGIGAAASFTILAAGMAGMAGVRRQRHGRPDTATSSEQHRTAYNPTASRGGTVPTTDARCPPVPAVLLKPAAHR